MKKRYEFTGETKQSYGRTLHQIRALVHIGTAAAGSLGGWIESESNLPHEGGGWVYEDASCFGKSVIRGGVIWGGEIWGGVILGGEIRGGVIWGGEIRGGVIWGGVIRGGVIWGGVIWGGVTTSPLVILGQRWMITVCDDVMTIGCQTHPIKEWLGFKDKTISVMDVSALELWNKNKALIFSMIDNSGRVYK